jgi:hypothetical protein
LNLGAAFGEIGGLGLRRYLLWLTELSSSALGQGILFGFCELRILELLVVKVALWVLRLLALLAEEASVLELGVCGRQRLGRLGLLRIIADRTASLLVSSGENAFLQRGEIHPERGFGSGGSRCGMDTERARCVCASSI